VKHGDNGMNKLVPAIFLAVFAVFICGCGGGGRGAPACVSNTRKGCSDGDVYWFDSCGNRGEIYDDCGEYETCSDSVCVSTCYSQAYKGCYEGDVYWYNSCDVRGDFVEDCEDSETCADGTCITEPCPYTCCESSECAGTAPYCANAGTAESQCVGCTEDEHCRTGATCENYVCTCSTHSSQACYSGDVYWFDSCGEAEEISMDCGEGEICQDAECISTSSCGMAYGNININRRGIVTLDFNDVAYDAVELSGGGFLVVGETDLQATRQGIDIWAVKLDEDLEIATGWPTDTIDFDETDVAYSVVEGGPGEYVVVGATNVGDDANFLAMQLDDSNNIVWSGDYGGAGIQLGYDVAVKTGGGYIMAGMTSEGDNGGYDAMIVEIDSSGVQTATRSHGTANDDQARAVVATAGGGYVVAGSSDFTGSGDFRMWAFAADAAGTGQWSYTYGAAGEHYALDIDATTDGGYIVGGYIKAGGGNPDMLVVKLDSNGTEEWSETYGGSGTDIIYSIVQTSDGGFIAAGDTNSTGAGGYDFAVLKLSSSGAEEWSRSYGDTQNENARAIRELAAGGYVVAGSTTSYEELLSEFWIIRIGSTGACDTLQ